MMGFGLSLLGLAGYFQTRRDVWLRLGTGLGVLFAFSSFLASNIQLHSDFLWFIAVLFGGAVAAALLLATGGLRGRSTPLRSLSPRDRGRAGPERDSSGQREEESPDRLS